MNGIEFVQEIDRRFPGTPYLLISGAVSTASLVSEAREMGQQIHVHPKPIVPHVLLDEIAKLLEAGHNATYHLDDLVRQTSLNGPQGTLENISTAVA